MNPPFSSALLDRRVQKETYRELPDLHGKIDFCSNHYLGLYQLLPVPLPY